MRKYRILGLVFGSYSGVREYFFPTLAKRHDVILPDLKFGRLYRYYSHFKSYIHISLALHDLPQHPVQWRQLTDKNKWRWLKQSQICERVVKRYKDDVDFVLQIGSKHAPYCKEKIAPYVVYTDGTRAITERKDPLCRMLN